MEPNLPPLPKPRLGRAFWITFLAPLLVGGFILLVAPGHAAEGPIGFTLLASVGCAIGSAVMLARSLVASSGGKVAMGLFCFALLQVFYTFALVGGCSSLHPMDFK